MSDAGPVGFGDRTFRAEGMEIFVSPLERRHPDGSSGITLGFPFATLSEYVEDEAVAPELAEYLSCPKRAAAPELYEALEAVCDFSDGFRNGELPSDPEAAELYRKSRAALAKARGQS